MTYPPGWYQDDSGHLRWWNGATWSNPGSVPPSPHRAGPITTLTAAAAGVVGSLGVWVAHPIANANGTDGSGEGFITLGLFVAASIASGIYLAGREGWAWVALGSSLLATIVAMHQLIDISGAVALVPGASVGWGLWLTVLAGFGASVGGFISAYFTERPPLRVP